MFEDPTLQALIRDAIANNLDLRIALAHVEEARARAGIAKSYLYPQVDGAVTYGVRGASTTEEANDTTRQSGTYGFHLSWEIDLFGRLRRGQEAAVALALATEQGRRGVLVTLVGDVATNYFLLRELDLQLEIARQTLRLNDETVTYFQNRLTGGVSNRLELDRIRAIREQTAAAIPEIERQIGQVENLISLLLGRPPGPIARQRLTNTEELPPPIPPGLPASLLERRPDVVAGRTASRGGQRRHRRCEIAVLSHDQPDRLSRRRQRRPHLVPRRERGSVVAGPGAAFSRSSRPGAFAGTSRRRRPDSTRRWPNTRRPRSTAIARSPTR